MTRKKRIERILSSFVGIPRKGRTLDKDLPLLASQGSLLIELETFEAIHDRIAELSALVAQNALVADAMPHQGWGVPDGWAPDEPEEAPDTLSEGAIRCSEAICSLEATPVSENLFQCARGHLTISETK